VIQNSITSWLLSEAQSFPTVPELFDALIFQLDKVGIPIVRANISLPTLHPHVIVFIFKWRRKNLADLPILSTYLKGSRIIDLEFGSVEESHYGYGVYDGDLHINSPFRDLALGARRIHHNFLPNTTNLRYPVLNDLSKLGATGYLALSIYFSDNKQSPTSWSTDKAGGFTKDDIRLIEGFLPALQLILELRMSHHKNRNLLELYLGKQTGQRVLEGTIQRGDIKTIHSVIWYSDLRNFTKMSNELTEYEVIEKLNHYFEVVSDCIEAAGGEILKFIGDAVLAIFPLENQDPTLLTRKAIEAAQNSFALLGTNEAGEPIQGVALHKGHIQYGNIGGKNRLDFTVIGNAVNLAARIESLCGKLGKEILISKEIANLFPEQTRSIGSFELKGFSDSKEIFEWIS